MDMVHGTVYNCKMDRSVRRFPCESNNPVSWDSAIYDASEIYKTRMHNICCDNCHSHVCTALDIMEYDGKSNWNMVKFFKSCFVMLAVAVKELVAAIEALPLCCKPSSSKLAIGADARGLKPSIC